jgi:hypothetical protein
MFSIYDNTKAYTLLVGKEDQVIGGWIIKMDLAEI